MSKHPESGHTSGDVTPPDDLERNPGTGTTRGSAGEDIDILEGDNTLEGDIANDTTAAGGIKVDQWGRKNA